MRGPRRSAPTLLAGVLVLTSLAGCASETEQYCDELKDQKQTLSDLAGAETPPSDALEQTREVFADLHDAAPADIKDEWFMLLNAYETLVEAFDAAGTTPAEYDPDSPPEGVTDDEVQRIEDAAAKLASRRVLDAADGLEQHARDVCKVDLGLGSGRG